jgi:hypothetical protein
MAAHTSNRAVPGDAIGDRLHQDSNTAQKIRPRIPNFEKLGQRSI